MADGSSAQPHLELVKRDALRGLTVAISVSDSADLSRLGLTPAHCELAVAELARAIFIAGGTIIYGGRLVPQGFTDVLTDELERYREDRDALVLCVPESEHRRLTNDELARRERELQVSAELICLDSSGEPVDIATRADSRRPIDVPAALSGMRRYVTGRCDARVLVGGKLRDFQGATPGVIEEATRSFEAGQPVYVAAGFGGAAAAAAQAVHAEATAWFPPNFPDGFESNAAALAELRTAASARPHRDGLSEIERRHLIATHRPGDIAGLVVTGLGRFRNGN